MNILTSRLYSALISPSTTSLRKSSSLHPSASSIKVPAPEGGAKVVGACNRQQYYRMREEGTSDSSNPNHLISSNLGDKMHDLASEYLDTYGFKMGIQKIDIEHSIYDEELKLSGRSDIIAWDHISQEVIGIEIKSVGEYKANACVERPAAEHVMQAMIYLDYYRNNIPTHQEKPTKWYIWYLSRVESWLLKANKHGSPLQMLWDFYITLDAEGVPTIHTSNGIERWSHFSIPKIKDRYRELQKHLDENTLPPRDFEITYSEERIAGLYKTDQLTRKADKEKVEKWLKKGAPEGKLKIEMGDIECSFCPWKSYCWTNQSLKQAAQFNLPLTTKQTEIDFIEEMF